ncbi:MAG: alpha-1,2-fucosyltransferase [Saprospiraceae bacterium]
MILVKLQGGLGNQLFQYAFGRAMELRHNCPVYYDYSYFGLKPNGIVAKRAFELHRFGLDLPKATIIRRYLGKIGSRLNLKNFRIIEEKNFNSPEEIKKIHQGYFIGYWQDVAYFQEYAEEIRRSIRAGFQLDDQNQALLRQIEQVNAVSVHVRRGDYLHPKLNRFLTQPVHYYQEAVKTISNQIDHPVFYFFSDDMEWVKTHLAHCRAKKIYVDINHDSHSYMDLILMSYCKHHILANSTFSWWGAYLDLHQEKIIIAPKEWQNSVQVTESL